MLTLHERLFAMDRRVICVSIPSFEIALARLEDSSLKKRAVAIAGTGPRAVAREVSSEAIQDGLVQGMDLQQALWLCPSLKILPPSGARVRRGQQELHEIVGRIAPVWESVGPGHVFLDVTGTHRLFGPAKDTASRVGAEIALRSGLSAALGVGTNKLVTHVATGMVRPAELYDVRPGSERPFMAPLPPRVLPELNRPAAHFIVGLLQDLNLSSLGSIADVPLPQLRLVLGSVSDELHPRSQGIDFAPVSPGRAQPWQVESVTLEPDAVEIDEISGSVCSLVERLSRKLRDHQVECHRLRVTAVHSDYVEVSREAEIDPATWWETDLFHVGEKLLKGALKRRVRVRRLILEAKVAPLAYEQLHLFSLTPPFQQAAQRQRDPDRDRRIVRALDNIRNRFGDRAVRWGRAVEHT